MNIIILIYNEANIDSQNIVIVPGTIFKNIKYFPDDLDTNMLMNFIV